MRNKILIIFCSALILACKKGSEITISGKWEGRVSISPNIDIYNTLVKANLNSDIKSISISDSLNSFPFTDAFSGTYDILGDSLLTTIQTSYAYYSFRFILLDNKTKMTGKWIVSGNGNYNTGNIYLIKK